MFTTKGNKSISQQTMKLISLETHLAYNQNKKIYGNVVVVAN